MRYAILTPPAGAPWVIGDDALSRGPGSKFILGGWPGFRQYVQNIPYLDNSFTRNIALGNRDVRFTIVAEYEFSSESECFLFVCSFPKLVPGTGVLQMGIRGTTAAQFTWPGCVVESVTPAGEVQGVSCRLSYSLLTGRPN